MTLTREEKIAKAKSLRAEGMKTVEIARTLKVNRNTVNRWLVGVPWPERICYVCGGSFVPAHGNQKVCCGENARKRFHEEQTRACCPQCGERLGPGSGYMSKAPELCSECEHLKRREVVDERGQLIEAWWSQGKSRKEIADLLGWSVSHVAVEMDRLRAAGYNLPYRHTHHKNPPRFPEQVAA